MQPKTSHISTSEFQNCLYNKVFWIVTRCLKIVRNVSFWKYEACCQTVLSDRSILIGQKLVENAKNQNATFWVIFKQRVVVTLKNDWNSFDFLRSEMSTPDKDLDTRKVIMTINQFRMILSDLQRIRETLLWFNTTQDFFSVTAKIFRSHLFVTICSDPTCTHTGARFNFWSENKMKSWIFRYFTFYKHRFLRENS